MMTTIFLILFHVAVLFAAAACWRADSGKRLVFTPFLIYMMVDFSFSWNTWLLFLETDVSVSDYAVVVSLAATLCFCLGFLFASKYIQDVSGAKVAGFQLQQYALQPFADHGYRLPYGAVFAVLALIGVACGTHYYQGYPPTVQAIARLAVEQQLPQDVHKEIHDIVVLGRRDLTKSHVFGGEYRGQGIVRGFMIGAWAYGLVLGLTLCSIGGRRRWWLVVFLFFVGAFYYVAGTGERSRFVWVLIMGLIGLSFATRLNLKKLALVGVIALSFLVVMTTFLKRYEPVEREGDLIFNVLAGVGDRIASGNKINNVRIMNFLEDKTLEYTYGRTHLREMMNVLPGIQELPLGHRLGEIIRPGKTTFYNGTYLGTVYIDFGLPGVIVVFLLLGALVRVAFHFLIRMPKRAENLAFMSFAFYNLGKMGLDGGIVSFASGMIPAVVIHLITKATLHLLTLQQSRVV